MTQLYPHKFFFERSFNPIAIYKIDCDVRDLNTKHLIFIDVNPAYERVNKVKKADVVGRSFYDVWPSVEPCWGNIIVECVKQEKPIHCENESRYTGKYLEVTAFPIAEGMAATIFLDRTEWKKSDEKLKSNQKKLMLYRTKLRELATRITLTEENTRREIATDLHDSIGHSLLSLMFDLRKLRENYDLPQDAVNVLENSLKVTEQMIAESRQLIFQLSPPILFEVGLNPAIEALADNLLSPRGIKWNISTRGSEKDYAADDAICVILYRMTRELLVNVMKHAKASEVWININRGPNGIQVVIEDNGIGLPKKFSFGRQSSPGLGLFSIRERLIHIGGDMQIISTKTGTTISLLAPLTIALGAPKENTEAEND